MADVIFPSKLVTERITVEFDFLDLMEWAETITSASFEVSLFTGVDPTPHDILYQTVIINSPKVRHRIQLGVPGVIYNLLCRVVGSSGNIYKKYGKLAILPSQAGYPPFTATYFTTPPYPIELIEIMSFSAVPISGTLHTLIVTTAFDDAASFSMFPVSGEMGAAFVEYSYDEAAVFSMIPQAGVMDVVLVEYDYSESASFSMVPASATMDTILVETLYTEAASFSMIPISGTMTT